MDFEQKDLINVNERFGVRRKREPKFDKTISEIVGKEIRTTDPRLIKLITKWKQEKGDDETPDNFLEDEAKVKELKETFI